MKALRILATAFIAAGIFVAGCSKNPVSDNPQNNPGGNSGTVAPYSRSDISTVGVVDTTADGFNVQGTANVKTPNGDVAFVNGWPQSVAAYPYGGRAGAYRHQSLGKEDRREARGGSGVGSLAEFQPCQDRIVELEGAGESAGGNRAYVPLDCGPGTHRTAAGQ